MLLDDIIMQFFNAENFFPKVIPLMAFREKLSCQKVRAVLGYHQTSPTKHIEQYAHHPLFSFYPFRDEDQLKSSPLTDTYVMNRE